MKDFFIFDQSDLSSVDLYYIHFANEYLKNSYSLEVEQIYKLAAYKLYIDYGGMI